MPLCEFESLEKGTPCRRGCGRLLPMTFRSRPLLPECSASCRHLGQPTGEQLPIVTATRCGGKTSRRTTAFCVHRCAVQGECLPSYRCSPQAVESAPRSIAACQGCESYERLPIE